MCFNGSHKLEWLAVLEPTLPDNTANWRPVYRMTVFYRTLLSIFVGCASRLTHWMGGALYIWTNGIAQRGAKTKHRPHSVVNQFKRFLYNHTATTRLRAEIILLWEIKKKASEPFFLPLSTTPYRCLLDAFILGLLFIHFSLPILRKMDCKQSIIHTLLDGIIRGVRRENACPQQQSIMKSIMKSLTRNTLYSTYIPVNIKMAIKK